MLEGHIDDELYKLIYSIQKQNILFSIRQGTIESKAGHITKQMHKKSKTQKSPYKSVQLKNSFYLNNKRSTIKSHDSNSNSIVAKSVSVSFKNNPKQKNCKTKNLRDRYLGLLTNRKQDKSLGNSALQNKSIKTAKKNNNTQYTHHQLCQPKQQQYNLSNLLGLSSIVSKKQSSTNSTHNEMVSQVISNDIFSPSCAAQIKKIKLQNQQVMRLNQHLLYQKEYFKQKCILQEVEIRDLTRKLEDLSHQARINKKFITNSSKFQQSELSFNIKSQNQKKSADTKHKKDSRYYQKDNKTRNFGTGTSKSSLLISESEQQQGFIIGKQNLLPEARKKQSFDFVNKTQSQFANLLQSVQNQQNPNRKMTLRKMLAIKAIQLKKVKQRADNRY